MSDEPQIRLRPRRPKPSPRDESKAWSKAFQGLMHVVRMTSKATRGSKHRSHQSARPVPRPTRQQRCAIRVTYSGNRIRGQWGAHGRYVMREGAVSPDQHLATAFTATADRVDLPAKLGEWQKAGDPRLFKMIVSPEFGERIDLEEHTRKLLARMESDLGAKLEWAAAAHFNTGHPHVHVAIRGVVGGQALRFDREFIQHGIRRHAEELCTAQLGYRTSADAQEAQRREVNQPRLTSLDRIIRRAGASHADDPNSFTVDVSHNGLVRPASTQLLIARLRVLTTMGVAAPQDSGSWSVRSDFEATLRAMQKLSDRQKMIAAHAALISDPRLPVQLTPANTISRLDGRVIGHSMDDSSGRTYLILEGTDARVHLIPHTPEIEAARFAGQLSPNHFIEIKARHGARRLAIRDRGDADQVLTQQRLPSSRPEGNVNGWAGWLGRYLSTIDRPRPVNHLPQKGLSV